jgi:hypothetical protein
VCIEPQRLRTPSASAAVTDTASRDGHCFKSPHPLHATKARGMGTDLCMVVGENTVGKTAVPSTQNRLGVAGDTQETKVTAALTYVSLVVARQLACAGEDGGTH